MRPTRFTFPAVDRDGICQAQTLGDAGNLVINGAYLDLPATMQGVARAVMPGGIERVMTLYSSADLSAVTFTFTGKNLAQETITEAILGPTAGATINTVNRYSQVDSIAASAAVATAIEIGTGPLGVTNWAVLDQWKDPFQTTVSLQMGGTLTVSVETTPDDVQEDDDPAIFVPEALEGVIASVSAQLGFQAAALRANINGAGSLNLTVLQAG